MSNFALTSLVVLRITSLLVSRLILNLKVAATGDHVSDLHATSHLEQQTMLENRIIGIAANKPEEWKAPKRHILRDKSMELRKL